MTQKIIIIGSVFVVFLVGGIWLLMSRRMRLREAALQAIIRTQVETSGQEELSASDRELLARLVAEVKNNMSQGDVSIEALASKLCLTRGQLNRRIKSVTGVTTQQYVLRIRLEHARYLLLENKETPVSEVAFDCGFDDATSFSRAFRRIFGKSPSQFRKDER